MASEHFGLKDCSNIVNDWFLNIKTSMIRSASNGFKTLEKLYVEEMKILNKAQSTFSEKIEGKSLSQVKVLLKLVPEPVCLAENFFQGIFDLKWVFDADNFLNQVEKTTKLMDKYFNFISVSEQIDLKKSRDTANSSLEQKIQLWRSAGFELLDSGIREIEMAENCHHLLVCNKKHRWQELYRYTSKQVLVNKVVNLMKVSLN